MKGLRVTDHGSGESVAGVLLQTVLTPSEVSTKLELDGFADVGLALTVLEFGQAANLCAKCHPRWTAKLSDGEVKNWREDLSRWTQSMPAEKLLEFVYSIGHVLRKNFNSVGSGDEVKKARQHCKTSEGQQNNLRLYDFIQFAYSDDPVKAQEAAQSKDELMATLDLADVADYALLRTLQPAAMIYDTGYKDAMAVLRQLALPVFDAACFYHLIKVAQNSRQREAFLEVMAHAHRAVEHVYIYVQPWIRATDLLKHRCGQGDTDLTSVEREITDGTPCSLTWSCNTIGEGQVRHPDLLRRAVEPITTQPWVRSVLRSYAEPVNFVAALRAYIKAIPELCADCNQSEEKALALHQRSWLRRLPPAEGYSILRAEKPSFFSKLRQAF